MNTYMQMAGLGVHIVLAAVLFGLAVWGYIATRLNGMLLLGVWVLWDRVLAWPLNILIMRWYGTGGRSGTPGMEYPQFMMVATQGRQVIGAILLAVAVAVLILEIKRLREAERGSA
ncbi:MAG: hypothetical protein PVH68_06065 [Armatimonadota bacterium]|jgi:hypothetical protein